MEEIHRFGADEWLLGVVEHVGESVHSQEMIARIHSHGLLAHSTLIRVSWRLKIIIRLQIYYLPGCDLGTE